MAEDRHEELRLRRAAKRIGWRLVKSRCRNLHINNRGLWQLIDDRNYVVGGANYDAALPECRFWIETEQRWLAA